MSENDDTILYEFIYGFISAGYFFLLAICVRQTISIKWRARRAFDVTGVTVTATDVFANNGSVANVGYVEKVNIRTTINGKYPKIAEYTGLTEFENVFFNNGTVLKARGVKYLSIVTNISN